MRRYLTLFLFFLILVAATRLPFIPRQIFSFDEVNLAYALDKLDIRLSQPQPPGYPLFVFQMHVLHLLRFLRPENNLIALALLGSAAAPAAVVWCGNRLFGGKTGIYAAMLLLFHSSFWYAGLSSALRVQLAILSALVAGCAWRAWNGEGCWNYIGAAALGVGAGVRPELGPLLVPLWFAAAVRSGAGWRSVLGSLAVMLAGVLTWLTPVALGSGGWAAYFAGCWEYLVGQGATTSPLFGLDAPRWTTTTVWLAVWTFSGLLFLPPLLILPRVGERIGWQRWAFFALWLGPMLLFALLVHVADPGHVLAMLVPVCVYMGRAVERVVEARAEWTPPSGDATLAAGLTVAALSIAMLSEPRWFRGFVILAGPLAALALRWKPGRANPALGSAAAACLLMLPTTAFYAHGMFVGRWYDERAGAFWHDVNAGFHVATIDHIKEIVEPDDRAIRAAQALAAERPADTVIVWERGRTNWRKLTYYLPTTRVLVLENQPVAIATWWRRSVELERTRGTAPLSVTVPAGARLIWATIAAESVSVTDLPLDAGSLKVGDFLLTWGSPKVE